MDRVINVESAVRRPGFTSKLVLGLFITTAVAVAVVAIASWWSFETGLSTYLTRVDAGKLMPLTRTLREDYALHGNWDFLRRHPGIWRQEIAQLFQSSPQHGFESRRQGPALGPRTGARVLNDPSGLHSRLRLLDASHRRVIGPPDRSGRASLLPVVVLGQTVGWLSVSPIPLAQDQLGAAFRSRQLHILTWIVLLALLLTPLLAYVLGRYLLSPLRRLTAATHSLAAGDYDMHIPVQTKDELGRLAEDFNRMATVLARNEQLRREAMADVSHELRTPIALLRAEIEALQDGIRVCDAERLGSLHGNVQRLSGLVEDLYQLALADASVLVYHQEACELDILVRDAAASAAETLATRDLQLELQLPGSLPLQGDPQRLRQLLDNLLTNSIRYTDPGGRVLVQVTRQDDQWVLTIEDSAPGVEPALLPRLFERFYRVEKSRNRARGGAGLGLAICKAIVEAHAGTIEARASSLGGVSIIVRLPVTMPTQLRGKAA